jgi:DTW domain-containing protein YfiP
LKNRTKHRCYICFRPLELCYCDSIPRVGNRTQVLILQHVAERYHPFNTARIVKHGLRRCQLVVRHNRDFATGDLPVAPDAVLLYPDEDATSGVRYHVGPRPSQLVVVDGTWHQAKTIVRDCRQLQTLPRLRLAPTQPGRYRIRREPTPQSLSTVEATVQALSCLEPETPGLGQLLVAFEAMVTAQMARRSKEQGTRQKVRSGGAHHKYPRALFSPASQLVVAYGEAAPASQDGASDLPLPVNWVAQRMDPNERFEQVLQQAVTLPQRVRDHMQLTGIAPEMCSNRAHFEREWRKFLKPNDVLVVYHARTSQLLQRAVGQCGRTVILKSICGKTPAASGSLNEVLRVLGLKPLDPWGPTRAHLRLAMAVVLVEYFRLCAHRL